MILVYLTGLSPLLFAVGKFLMSNNLDLESSQDFLPILSSFLAIYLYLTGFLGLYVWKESQFYPEYVANQIRLEEIKHSNCSSYSDFWSSEQIILATEEITS